MARKESDIDVAVLVSAKDAPPHVELLKLLLRRFSRAVACDKLDLVVLNNTPALLRFQVIKYGQIVYARDSRARVQFVANTLRDYHDGEARRRAYARIRLTRLRRSRDHHGGSRDFRAAIRRTERLLAEAQSIPTG